MVKSVIFFILHTRNGARTWSDHCPDNLMITTGYGMTQVVCEARS